jgi:HK97 gp10 family phage protein
MIDASDVTRFARRLSSSPGPIEDPWRREMSRELADEMQDRAPVLTGELRDSITVTDEGVEVLAEYGPYVEYGTADTPPQPFAGPAADSLAPKAAERAAERAVQSLRT